MMQLLKLCVLGAALIAVPATAGQVNEMVMPTEVGEIVLTLEECPVKNDYGFNYYGYATEKDADNHFGCWNADDAIVQIWFINENVVGIYKKELFKPRLGV
jgi:hypothetical protein